ncbi:MAG: hypothetical protein ACRCWJ_11645 [Casimicrobium sp.]
MKNALEKIYFEVRRREAKKRPGVAVKKWNDCALDALHRKKRSGAKTRDLALEYGVTTAFLLEKIKQKERNDAALSTQMLRLLEIAPAVSAIADLPVFYPSVKGNRLYRSLDVKSANDCDINYASNS